MLIPSLNSINQKKQTIDNFLGIDNRPGAPFGSLKDSLGLTVNSYGALCSGVSIRNFYNGNGIDNLGISDQLYFFYDNELVWDGSYTKLKCAKKQTAVIKFGIWVVVFPEKKAYNTETEEIISLENTFEGEAEILVCSSDGTEISFVSSPHKPADAEYWCDTSASEPVLKRFASGSYYTVDSPKLKIKAEGIEEGFKVGDSVKVSALTPDSERVIRALGENYILVDGVLASNINGSLVLKREIPEINYAIAFGNRIWGTSKNGTEIYASALGSFDNFFCFEGVSSDSYTVSVGDAGSFVGIAEFENALYFFKRDRVYSLFGTKPSNFQLRCYKIEGPKVGANNQIVLHKGFLYYVSILGLMRFNGASSEPVLKKLKTSLTKCSLVSNGENLFFHADGNLFMINTDSMKVLKVYSGDISSVCYYLSYITFSTSSGIKFLIMGDKSPEFMAEFNSGCEKAEKDSFLKRIYLNLMLGENSNLAVEISYDGKPYKVVSTLSGKNKSYYIPIQLSRHRELALRLSGSGIFRLYSVSLVKSEVE